MDNKKDIGGFIQMNKWIEVQDNAEKYFNSGYNCCESVVLAVSEYFGVDKEMPLKIATPFGSGMSKNGCVCGALSAAFISSGMINGRKQSDESRDPAYIPADNIFNRFKEKYGTAFCADITNVNFRDPEEVAKNKARLHNELCGPIVKQVAYWIMEEMDK